MPVEPFRKHQEQAFETWRRAHPNGYVFNHFGGSAKEHNNLHRVDLKLNLRGDPTDLIVLITAVVVIFAIFL